MDRKAEEEPIAELLATTTTPRGARPAGAQQSGDLRDTPWAAAPRSTLGNRSRIGEETRATRQEADGESRQLRPVRPGGRGADRPRGGPAGPWGGGGPGQGGLLRGESHRLEEPQRRHAPAHRRVPDPAPRRRRGDRGGGGG